MRGDASWTASRKIMPRSIDWRAVFSDLRRRVRNGHARIRKLSPHDEFLILRHAAVS